MENNRIRVLIVDDSALVRGLVRNALVLHPRIEVVGFAADGEEALQRIRDLEPDVVTLDTEMPRLDGLGVLDGVSPDARTAFVLVTSLTHASASRAFDALEHGAYNYVARPRPGAVGELLKFKARLHRVVVAAAKSRGKRGLPTIQPVRYESQAAPDCAGDAVVAIGSGCGGPQSLRALLPAFPKDFAPIVVAQHMPPEFTGAFVQRVASGAAMLVREAVHHERLRRGTIYVAPGGYHLRVQRRGGELCTELSSGPRISGHCPSIDVLFSSLANACGPGVVGVLMTGLGSDGADGLLRLHRAGAWTIAQDPESSLATEMATAATAAGGVCEIAPLDQIPRAVARSLSLPAARPAVV
ncbi:MAG: chemotaxis-specific protein-glutamate methyltransferase CheB [Phycisphaerae bacterium]